MYCTNIAWLSAQPFTKNEQLFPKANSTVIYVYIVSRCFFYINLIILYNFSFVVGNEDTN